MSMMWVMHPITHEIRSDKSIFWEWAILIHLCKDTIVDAATLNTILVQTLSLIACQSHIEIYNIRCQGKLSTATISLFTRKPAVSVCEGGGSLFDNLLTWNTPSPIQQGGVSVRRCYGMKTSLIDWMLQQTDGEEHKRNLSSRICVSWQLSYKRAPSSYVTTRTSKIMGTLNHVKIVK